MSKVDLKRISDGSRGCDPLCLTVDIAHLLDHMSEDAQKEFVGYAVADGELLKILCQEVAGYHIDHGSSPVADVWLGSETRMKLREALSPILGAAVAEELKAAIEKAARFEKAHDTLRSLAHIKQMIREARQEDDSRCVETRCRQWDSVWSEVEAMFPEYAAIKTEATK